MRIDAHQLVVLGNARAAAYEQRLMEFLREEIAPRSDRAVVLDDVRARIVEAEQWALDTERQIAAFVIGAWTFGDVFLSHIEPLRPVFANPNVDPAEKASMMLEEFDALWLPPSPPRP